MPTSKRKPGCRQLTGPPKPPKSPQPRKAKSVRHFLSEKCPQCSRNLVEVVAMKGKFIGCSGYPDCKYSRSVKK